ncbi:protein of unknown function [Pseudogulbenkiania sp. NH8B]|uniref:DUF2249 domain-containing protein n=1 Tax=Pseudogulbenkiania sp. (strain NH8B) TaxID=748280 RepID=UPI0002279A53|nr:DUF2249 domain-containing protein [Pseudogulbenkiania sp. NH8B]BAK77451.1 protein of unknown function [Pseudogulbenkiania sp. NH8B]
MSELPVLDNNVFPFDARGVAKRFRHAAIFGAIESLYDGDTMRFINDHDPLPLLDQLRQRYGHQLTFSYVAREPGNIVIDFKVQLGEQAADGQQQAVSEAPAQGGGCGGGGGGCGCSGH